MWGGGEDPVEFEMAENDNILTKLHDLLLYLLPLLAKFPRDQAFLLADRFS